MVRQQLVPLSFSGTWVRDLGRAQVVPARLFLVPLVIVRPIAFDETIMPSLVAIDPILMVVVMARNSTDILDIAHTIRVGLRQKLGLGH